MLPILQNLLSYFVTQSDRPIEKLRHEVNHALNSVQWLLVLAPDATETLQVATMFHDCERFFEVRTLPAEFGSYQEYKQAHARNTAQLISQALNAHNRADLSPHVSELIERHEVGGTPESDLLMTADSFAYFDKNIFDYYRWRGVDETKKKIAFMYQRIPKEWRSRFDETDFDFRHDERLVPLFKEVALT